MIIKYFIIFILLLLNISYSSASDQKEKYNYYIKKYQNNDNGFYRTKIISMLIDVGYFNSANNYLNNNEYNENNYWKSEIDFYKTKLDYLLNNSINAEIKNTYSVNSNHQIKNLLFNAKYNLDKNKPFLSYYYAIEALGYMLSLNWKTYTEGEHLYEIANVLNELKQYELSGTIYNLLDANYSKLDTKEKIGIDFSILYYNNWKNVFNIDSDNNNKYIDNLYENEASFITLDNYKKYWYTKLLKNFSNHKFFEKIILDLKKFNKNKENYNKIKPGIIRLFNYWKNIVYFNKITLEEKNDLDNIRKEFKKFDDFKTIADGLYLRALIINGELDKFYNEINKAIYDYRNTLYIRKSLSSNSSHSVSLSDYVFTISIYRILNYLKQNNYKYKTLLYEMMVTKHYHMSSNELENMYSKDLISSDIDHKNLYSRYNLINSLVIEYKKRLKDEIFDRPENPDNSSDVYFKIGVDNSIDKLKRIDKWSHTLQSTNKKREPILNLNDIQSNLEKNEILFINNIYGPFITQICITKDNIIDSIGSYHETYNEDKKKVKLSLKNFGKIFPIKSSENLYKTLFSLLEQCVKNKNQYITILTDPEAVDIPVSVLKVPGKSDQWFVQKYNFTLLPSPKSFIPKESKYLPKKEYLGIGDPILNHDDKNNLDINFDDLIVTRGIQDYQSIKNLPGLPATNNEIRNTAKLFDNNKILLKDDASEINVRLLSLYDYEIIHFATHAITSESFIKNSNPGLILTPKKDSNHLNDGFLSSKDIMEYDIPAKLIILSACNTALDEGDIYKFGFSDLTQSFLIAGAKNVLATQWEIPSKETTKLIENILKHYKNTKNTGINYQKGLIDYINISNNKSNPYFWASFIPIGRNKRNLDKKQKISLESIYRNGNKKSMDTLAKGFKYNNKVYASGITTVPGEIENTKPILIEYNLDDGSIKEIDIDGYNAISIVNVYENKLLLLLNEIDWFKSLKISFASYDLKTNNLKIFDQHKFTNAEKISGPLTYFKSSLYNKHYFSASLKGESENIHELLIYIYSDEYALEKIIKEKYFSNALMNISTIIENKKDVFLYLNTEKETKLGRRICDNTKFLRKYTINNSNKLEFKSVEKNIFYSLFDKTSNYIPIKRFVLDEGLYPCFTEEIDLYDLFNGEYKNINIKNPLGSVMPFLVYNESKYILTLPRPLIFDINFDGKKVFHPYDLKNSFDYKIQGVQYEMINELIYVLNKNYKLEKTISFSTRSYSSIESLVVDNDKNILLLGSRDNLLSIDKLSGLRD